jgi:histidine triad (HIT) family protein
MDDCIFCKIVRHEIPAQIVYEDDDVVAFKDLNPVAPVHILVIPKKHISELKAISDEDRELMGKLMVVIGKLARENSTDDEGFRLVVNQGEQAGQSVFHLHFHLMGGRSFGWPPG